MEWISVKDRLPDTGKSVLVSVDGYKEALYGWRRDLRYHKSGRAAEWETWTRVLHNVTHWMPLPEPPKP